MSKKVINILGQKVKDNITGFVGVAVSFIQYLDGSAQYGIIPVIGENKDYPKVQYINECQLTVVDKYKEIGFKPVRLKKKTSNKISCF